MSEIRTYLEQKAALPENEWLKREPRSTLPAILDEVRAYRARVGSRVAYNDDAEQAVERLAGDLPEHRYHAHPERHRLTDQLGSEVYIAQCICHDEQNAARAEELRADGFVPLEQVEEVGKVYDVAPGIVYSGYELPSYGKVHERCRFAGRQNGRPVFLRPRARTNGFTGDHVLVREVSA